MVEIGGTEDDLLIQQCLKGDEDAWTEMVRSHAPRLLRMSLRFTRRSDEAEEVTQEIIVRVYQCLGSYRIGAGTFRYWISRVARNCLIDHYRRTRRREIPIDDVEAANVKDGRMPDPLQSLEHAEASAVVRRALRALPAGSRKVIQLREIDGMEYAEMAATLGIPKGTIKSRIHRARGELTQLLVRQRRSQDHVQPQNLQMAEI